MKGVENISGRIVSDLPECIEIQLAPNINIDILPQYDFGDLGEPVVYFKMFINYSLTINHEVQDATYGLLLDETGDYIREVGFTKIPEALEQAVFSWKDRAVEILFKEHLRG